MKKQLVTTLFITRICFAGIEEQLISVQEIELENTCPMLGWIEDLHKAKQIAKEKNQPLLIAFLGPDGCVPSDKLKEKVLNDPSFQQLKKKCILAKVHSLRDCEEIPYKEEYKIDRFPCIILATPTGEEIAKVDHFPVNCKACINLLEEILKDYDKLSSLSESALKTFSGNELKTLYIKAKRLANTTLQNAVFAQGLKRAKDSYFLFEQYKTLSASDQHKERHMRKLRKQILARDPQNKKGYIRKMAIIDFHRLAKSSKQNSDVVIHPIVEYLKTFGTRDQDHAWRLEMKLSQYFFSQNQVESALKHAKNSLDLAPEEKKQEIAKSIDYLNCLEGISPRDNS